MGTRKLNRGTLWLVKDHPHAYGDKKVACSALSADTGSSPRVWGQGSFEQRKDTLSRIIPTRMGTREVNLQTDKIRKDHPHAYGDKSRYFQQVILILGSSPRVWGQERY